MLDRSVTAEHFDVMFILSVPWRAVRAVLDSHRHTAPAGISTREAQVPRHGWTILYSIDVSAGAHCKAIYRNYLSAGQDWLLAYCMVMIGTVQGGHSTTYPVRRGHLGLKTVIPSACFRCTDIRYAEQTASL